MRLAYIHVGTHKTGTTSIQATLAANEIALARTGICIPRTGRLTPSLAAHHNIAFELAQNTQFDANLGTLATLLEEIRTTDAPIVCLSSEEFESLAFNRGGLQRLFTGFLGIGYDVRIVLYLRPQADYIESLYATIVAGGWPIDFAPFVATILEHGAYGDSILDYVRLVDAFATGFHRNRLIVRRYRSSAIPDTLPREFLGIIGGADLSFETLSLPGKLNTRLSFDHILSTRARSDQRIIPKHLEFEPLTLADIARIILRFGRSNARLSKLYGIDLPTITRRRLARELAVAISGDGEVLVRKRLVRYGETTLPRGGEARAARIQEFIHGHLP